MRGFSIGLRTLAAVGMGVVLMAGDGVGQVAPPAPPAPVPGPPPAVTPAPGTPANRQGAAVPGRPGRRPVAIGMQGLDQPVRRPRWPTRSVFEPPRLLQHPVQAPAAPDSSVSVTPALEAVERVRVHVPRARPGRPVATGMDGLDVPINRRTYAGNPNPRLPLLGGAAGAGFRAGAGLTPVMPGRQFLTGRGIEAPNAWGGSDRYSLYTYYNTLGNQTAILYDRGTGQARTYDLFVSGGRTFSVPRALDSAGAALDTLQLPGPGRDPRIPGAVTFGRGVGSYSGAVMNPSVDSRVGPATGMPSLNPAVPSYMPGTLYFGNTGAGGATNSGGASVGVGGATPSYVSPGISGGSGTP